jgi:hypothetical protein
VVEKWFSTRSWKRLRRIKTDKFLDYKDWLVGNPFPEKGEMREAVCPAWWYQNVDYKRKPEWDECTGCGRFSDCKNFKTKEKCWERFDKEGK